MSLKRKVTVNINIDLTCKERRPWYLDIYDLQGVKFQKVHLFVGSADGGNTFEDLGQV